MKSGGCYAVGDIFSSSREEGQPLISGLIGKIVESPIFLDYLKETHLFAGPTAAVMAFTLLLDMDFVDLSVSKTPYLKTLLRWHPYLPKAEIEPMNPTRPDILTKDGLRIGGGIAIGKDRNEYYEVKSDSQTGTKDGDHDLGRIKEFFDQLIKTYKLKTRYLPGTTYPMTAAAEKRLALPLNRDFANLASIFLRRYSFTKLECYLVVRRSKPGLLQYKICFDFDSDDDARKQTLAKAAAKVLAAAYVVTTMPWRFPQAELELGDHTLEGDALPRLRCTFDVIPDLMPLVKSIEDCIRMRGLAYPGDELLLFCDEGYYWTLLAQHPIGIDAIWQQAKAAFKNWVDYAPGSPGWARFQPWVDKAEAIGEEIRRKFPYHVELADALIEYGRRNPLTVIAVVVLPIILTAGLAALIDAGLIGGALIAEGTATELSAPVVGGLGRTAMTSTLAAETLGTETATGAAAPGLLTSQQVGSIGGLGASANETATLARIASGPLLSNTAKQVGSMGVAAAFLLGVSARTAYAQTRTSGTTQAAPADPSTGKVVAEIMDRLLAVTPLPAPRNTLEPLIKARSVNVHNYAPTSPLDRALRDGKPITLDSDLGPAPPLNMRYLGRVKVA